MAKHAKKEELAPEEVFVSGKHVAVVRRGLDIPQILLSVLLVATLAIVPFSFNRVLVAMDHQAFAESSIFGVSDQGSSRLTLAKISGEGEEAEDNVSSFADYNNLGNILPAVDYTQRVSEKRQVGLLDGGCELVSLTIVLDAMGFNPDIHKLVEDHLNIDGSFATGYSGNPYHLGAGYPEGIAAAADSYLKSVGSKAQAINLTGLSFESLKAYTAKGYPVLVWTTMGFKNPAYTGFFNGEHEWYSNEHCVVMYGSSDENVFLSDPLDGMVVRESQRFEEIYEACGSMALVVL